jgi:hypothetical protein
MHCIAAFEVGRAPNCAAQEKPMRFDLTRALRRHASPLICFGLLAAGCAADVRPQPLAEGDVELPEGARELASVELNEGHAIKFYDLGGGHSLVVEAMDMDAADSVALTSEMMQAHGLAGVYAQLAGNTADPAMQRVLAAYDAENPFVPTAPAEIAAARTTSAAALEWTQSVDDSVVEKDAFSEAYFFSNNWCNRCMGWQGTKMSWMPQDRTVCTTSPEACVTSAGAWEGNLRSNNLRIAGYNQSSSNTATLRMYLNDPCENDSWWSRTFSVCTKGSSLVNFTMQPKTAYGFFTSTSGASWSRHVAWLGSNVGIMWDVY